MDRLTKRGKGLPLSLYIAKYFVLMLVFMAAVWIACFAALSASMNAGLVYPANWGAANAELTAKSIQDEGAFDAQSVPSAYRYALFDPDGRTVSTDMDDDMLERALAIRSEAESTRETEVVGSSGATYVAFDIPDGTSCVLASTYMPQFASTTLREALPNPQNLMLAAGAVGSVVAMVLVARRAGRALARRMAPLTDAAARVARQDLEFSVEPGGVREVNEILSAMDAMRASIKESLEARWDAEQRQRDQVAALAHDLKTPLTIVRANAEFIAEETSGLAAKPLPAGPEELRSLADAASAAASGARRLDSYVGLLIETSRGFSRQSCENATSVEELASIVEADGSLLAQTAGTAFEFLLDEKAAESWVKGSKDSLSRAVMNIVENAVEHASKRVNVTLRRSEGFLDIEVTDDGSGFSPEALAHGRERFFQDDLSRSGNHYGLGLHAASEIARACKGELTMSNVKDGKQGAQGACVVLRIPTA